MFSLANEIASKFTQPLLISARYFSKKIESGIGSFVILNDEGWLMTVAHNLDILLIANQHQIDLQQFRDIVSKTNSSPTLSIKAKKSIIEKNRPNQNWITNSSIWLGIDGATIIQDYIFKEHDLAFIRIDPKYLEGFNDYPKIKNPQNLKVGTSLCKLGFPFYEVKSTFDEEKNLFIFPPDIFPIPRFPIDGIYTRNLIVGNDTENRAIIYLETSSPGLKGQSGGPIFDVDGNIWAIQSKNATMDLGFKGVKIVKGRKVEENQFINIGVGVHPQTIVDLLTKCNINFQIAD